MLKHNPRGFAMMFRHFISSFEGLIMTCQRTAHVAALAAISLLCASGCGKIPTWDELQGKQAPAPVSKPAPAAQAPIQIQPVAPPQVAPKEDPEQVLNWFKSLQPSHV